jgi:hypothetical protein
MSRVSFALVVAVALSGVLGTWRGRRAADYQYENGGPIATSQRDTIRLEGYAEAAQCTDVAVRVGALPLLMSWIAAMRIGYALSRRKDESGSEPRAKDR